MTDLLAALVRRDRPVGREMWHAFLQRLAERRLLIGEAAAVVASLSTTMPDDATLGALIDCLDERRDAPVDRMAGTVNIMGTGGGAPTFNISTAAAIVAAAIGVRVVKTGTRAYRGRRGSFDLLDHLGIARTGSHQETEDWLDRYGIAFAGPYVYPPEIGMLTRELVPLGLDPLGGFVNTLGPFLADVPVTAQLTGVSVSAPLPSLRFLADRERNRRVWLCHNMLGVDELVSMADNVICPNDGEPDFTVPALGVGTDYGTLADLRPSAQDPSVCFRSILSGRTADAAVQTVCLNAAAVAVLSGHYEDWDTACYDAESAIRDGAALRLMTCLRAARVRSPMNARD